MQDLVDKVLYNVLQLKEGFPYEIFLSFAIRQKPRKTTQTPRILILSVAPPAEPRGEKKLFFVQILGGEKLLKFGEKWAVNNF